MDLREMPYNPWNHRQLRRTQPHRHVQLVCQHGTFLSTCDCDDPDKPIEQSVCLASDGCPAWPAKDRPPFPVAPVRDTGPMAFTYTAHVVDVVDGDTLDVTLDLGFRIYHRERIRVYGVNTPERGQPGYQAAKDRVAQLCLDRDVHVVTHKPADKYGRWLASVAVPDKEGEFTLAVSDLAAILIGANLGVAYFGGART